jgi:hypothetical protein
MQGKAPSVCTSLPVGGVGDCFFFLGNSLVASECNDVFREAASGKSVTLASSRGRVVNFWWWWWWWIHYFSRERAGLKVWSRRPDRLCPRLLGRRAERGLPEGKAGFLIPEWVRFKSLLMRLLRAGVMGAFPAPRRPVWSAFISEVEARLSGCDAIELSCLARC